MEWNRCGGLLALALILGARVASGTVADDLCAPLADPCVVSSAVTASTGSTLDFGVRTLQLSPGAAVIWSGDLTITAGACDFQPDSALSEAVETAGTPFLTLNCGTSTLAGSIATRGAGILVEGPGPHLISGSIKAQGDQVGVIAVDALSPPGHITVSGKIQVTSKVGTPPGEFRLQTNFGNIVVAPTAKIKVSGATANPFTESFFFLAESGSLTIDGSIDARAKTGAYALNFEANQAVVFGPKSKIIAKAAVTGPEVAINSQLSSVTLRGKINAATKSVSSGDGPRVRVCAGSDILLDGKSSIDASTGTSDGSIVLGAVGTARVGTVAVGAKLYAKTDGDIEVCGGTSGSISNSSKVVPAPQAVGSNVCLSPGSQVIFLLDCNAP